MLQAKLNNGKLITPAMFSRQKLLQLKAERQVFFCPVCEDKVILRAGEKVIAHFAHAKNTDCPTAGGGEGAYHEQGKLQLYRWLCNQGIHVGLESYLPAIRQRPDLLIQFKEKIIAIEYQCTKVANEEIINRTAGYHQSGIHVIWLLGERLMKRKGSTILGLDSSTQTMLHQFTPEYPLSLFYFCPLTSKFIKFQDITFISKHRAAGRLTIKHLEQTNFRELLAKEYIAKNFCKKIWKREKERFRLKRRARPSGREREWLSWLYEKGIYSEQLPSIVHLPIPSDYMMKVPGWIWQSKVVLHIIAPRQIGEIFSLSQCMRITKYDLLPRNNFPLINSSANPVLEYLQLLCKAGILQQISKTSFKKLSEINLHHQLETAIKADSQLIDTLF